MRSITNNLPVLIAFMDNKCKYQFANATYKQWYDMNPADLIGKHPREVWPESVCAITEPYMLRALAGEKVTFSLTSTRPGVPEHACVMYVPDFSETGSVLGFNVLVFDETERQNNEDNLSSLAHFDPLTKLPNRRLFEERLQKSISSSLQEKKMSALLFMDVDYFKKINDTYGHESGDLLLKEFGARVSSIVRSNDTVARLGGDEFVVLLDGITEKTNAESIANKILEKIREPFVLNEVTLNVTTSIGISYSEIENISIGSYLKQSDKALYAAKQAGRNQYFIFTHELK